MTKNFILLRDDEVCAKVFPATAGGTSNASRHQGELVQSPASKDNVSKMHMKANELKHAMINKHQVGKDSLSEMHVKANQTRYAMSTKFLINEANAILTRRLLALCHEARERSVRDNT